MDEMQVWEVVAVVEDHMAKQLITFGIVLPITVIPVQMDVLLLHGRKG